MGWWILVAIVVLVVLWLVFTYNGLISARNRTQEAWSEIDVELKRRHPRFQAVRLLPGGRGRSHGATGQLRQRSAREHASAGGRPGRASRPRLRGTPTPELARELLPVHGEAAPKVPEGLRAGPRPV